MEFTLSKEQFNLIMRLGKFTCGSSDRPILQNICIEITDKFLLAEAINGFYVQQLKFNLSKIENYQGQGVVYMLPIKPHTNDFVFVNFSTGDKTVEMKFIRTNYPGFTYTVSTENKGWKEPSEMGNKIDTDNFFFEPDKSLTICLDGNLLARLISKNSRNIVKLCFQKDKNGGIDKCHPFEIIEKNTENCETRSVLLPVRCDDEEKI